MAVASAGLYASLHLAPDRQPHQHPTTQFFYRPDALPSAQPTASEQTHIDTKRNIGPNDAYGTGQTSKLLILSECVDKTEKIGGTRRNTNSYRENAALSDISREIFCVTIV